MSEALKSLLIVDDDDVMREKFGRMLRNAPYQITEASSGKHATFLLETKEFDCILLDYDLGDSIGLDLIPLIQSTTQRPCPVIMITGLRDDRLIVNAMRNGVFEFMHKNDIVGDELTKMINDSFHWAKIESELRESQEKLKHLSLYDELTSLPNRHLFFDRLAQAKLTAIRDNTMFALLMMDLNMFKEVNDTIGHLAGDDLLAQVGQRLHNISRESDTYARLGGDEFAVILNDIQSLDNAMQIAAKIIDAINVPFDIENKLVHISISIGISMYPDDEINTRSLLAKADNAMYKAKQSSRGYEHCFDETPAPPQSRLMLGSMLGVALENREICMHYQPQINLTTGLFCGVEALARWSSPTLGNVPPDQFIVAAERSLMIKPLTQATFEMALAQLSAWKSEGLEIPIAVNLSAKLLDVSTLVLEILNLLSQHQISPHLLTIEITETALMANLNSASKMIKALSDHGIKISIDDFGTGYTSFRFLRDFALNEIKIDKIFVSGLQEQSRDVSIIESFISLSKGFQANLIAEGVEDQECLNILKKIGCDRAQGYFIGRPMPADEIPLWLKRWETNNSVKHSL